MFAFCSPSRNALAQGAKGGSGWLRPPPRMDGRVVQKALRRLWNGGWGDNHHSREVSTPSVGLFGTTFSLRTP